MLVRKAEPSSAPVSAVTESALTAKAVMPARGSFERSYDRYLSRPPPRLQTTDLEQLLAATGL